MENKKSGLKGIIILILVCLLVMGGAFAFSRACLVVFPIEGESMESTIHDGDFVLLFKTQKVKYDDVIVVHVTGDTPWVKRVVGLAGDKIDIVEEDGYFHIYRNGEMVSEEHIKEPITGNYSEMSLIVPENKIFFLGDNRMHSTDSHYGYLADVDKVEGVGILKYKGWKIKFL